MLLIGRTWREPSCWISLSNAHELTSVQEGIPHWFHTKMSQVAWGIRRDECPSSNEGHSFATQGKWIFFTNWQGCFGKQENANNKMYLKKMTTKSVNNVRSAGKLLSYTVLFFVHLDPNFRGVFCLTSGRKWPNFGAKWAQLQKPAIYPEFAKNWANIAVLWANMA